MSAIPNTKSTSRSILKRLLNNPFFEVSSALKLMCLQQVGLVQMMELELSNKNLLSAHRLIILIFQKLEDCFNIASEEINHLILEEVERVMKLNKLIVFHLEQDSVTNGFKHEIRDFELGILNYQTKMIVPIATKPITTIPFASTSSNKAKNNAAGGSSGAHTSTPMALKSDKQILEKKNSREIQNGSQATSSGIAAKSSCINLSQPKTKPTVNTLPSETTDVEIPTTEKKGYEAFKYNFFKILEHTATTTTEIKGLNDVIGYNDVKKEILETVIYPRKYRKQCHGELINCLMLYGPPGTGKSLFMETIACELKRAYLPITGADINDKFSGNNLLKLRAAFEVTKSVGNTILFFDEAEAMFPDRSNTRSECAKEVVCQALQEINNLFSFNFKNPNRDVLLIAATNYPGTIDPAMWRRMNKFIHVGMPDPTARKQILTSMIGESLLCNMSDKNWETITYLTDGFTPADLHRLSNSVKYVAPRKAFSSTFFRPVNSKLYGKTEKDWIPCKATEEGAVELTFPEAAEKGLDIVYPGFTPFNFIEVAKGMEPTLNYRDENGPVKVCLRFHKQFGQQLLINFDANFTDEITEDTVLEEAKQKFIENGGTEEDGVCLPNMPPQKLIVPVWLNGRLQGMPNDFQTSAQNANSEVVKVKHICIIM